MRLFSLVGLTMALVGCAPKAMSHKESQPKDRLPNPEEVIAHVRSEWKNGFGYGRRVARDESRPDETPELVEVSNVRCEYYIVTPECTFDVTARFPGEPTKIWPMFNQFGWDDKGQLQWVIVMYHERRN